MATGGKSHKNRREMMPINILKRKNFVRHKLNVILETARYFFKELEDVWHILPGTPHRKG